MVANHLANTVSVLLQNADGTFQPKVDYGVGARPRGVMLANLDGDAFADVVTANQDGDNVSVLLGVGDGTLQSAVNYAAGNGASRVAVADLNGDTHLDLVTANYNAHTIGVLAGNGDGSFLAPVAYSTGASSNPRDVVLADLDGDGNLDAATANYYGLLSLLKGNGDGTFQPSSGPVYGGSYYDTYQLTAADLNGDGVDDLAVAGYGQDRLYLLFNQGGGFDDVAATIVHYDTGNPIGVTASDFNGDGFADLAASNYTSHNVAVYLGNEATPLTVDPADSGLSSAHGRGNLSSASDVDYFRFTGQAGQRVTLAAENPNGSYYSRLSFALLRPDGNTQASLVTGVNGAPAETGPTTLPQTGTYLVRVTSYDDFQGEYRVRVTLADPPLQLESESNDSTANADVVDLAADGAAQVATVAGTVGSSDAGDTYLLGNLTAGTTISLGITQPSTSSLTAEVAILKGDTVVATGTGSYDIPPGEDGTYYARVSAAAGTAGLASQYLLSIQLADLVSPFVTGTNLPAEGTTITDIYDRFNLSFSEDMLASTINDSLNYELQEAGTDGTFDTPDDLYVVVTRVTYGSGLTAQYRIDDGPLQPGHYRFTATAGLTDKVGNPLAPEFTRTFFVEGIPPYVLENRSNDTQATATPLVEPAAGADGSFSLLTRTAVGTSPHHIASGDVNGDGLPDVITSNYSTRQCLGLAEPGRWHHRPHGLRGG